MKPHRLLDSVRTPDGDLLTLARDGDELTIRIQGRTLMSTLAHGSEEALALHGCAHLTGARPRGRRHERRGPRVLVGGLGLGYTLRAALDVLPPSASVVCAELLGAIADWHRPGGPLGELAGRPLADPRVTLVVDDVRRVIAAAAAGDGEPFDAILLDVDNGPTPITSRGNAALYGEAGLSRMVRALAPEGVLAVWSAFDDRGFAARMRKSGLSTRVVRTGAQRRVQNDWNHFLFVGRRG